MKNQTKMGRNIDLGIPSEIFFSPFPSISKRNKKETAILSHAFLVLRFLHPT